MCRISFYVSLTYLPHMYVIIRQLHFCEIPQAILNEFNEIHEQIIFYVYTYLTSYNRFMFTVNKQFHSFQCVSD